MSATGDCVSWQCELCAATWFTLVIWGWPPVSPLAKDDPSLAPDPPKAVHCGCGVSWALCWAATLCAQDGSSCPQHLHLSIAELLVSWLGQEGLGLNSCPRVSPPGVTLFLLQNTSYSLDDVLPRTTCSWQGSDLTNVSLKIWHDIPDKWPQAG